MRSLAHRTTIIIVGVDITGTGMLVAEFPKGWSTA